VKTTRQNEILRLIAAREIETQEDLAEALRDRGYQVTQATVSRDIRELKLIKVATVSGAYRYARPDKHETMVSERLIRILTDSLVSVDVAGNLVVVKTLSGSANVAAEALDTLQWSEILGTIAGDNTIFVACREGQEAAAVAERIREMSYHVV